jgi:hypothetical protein
VRLGSGASNPAPRKKTTTCFARRNVGSLRNRNTSRGKHGENNVASLVFPRSGVSMVDTIGGL